MSKGGINAPGYEMRANSPIGKLHRRIRETFLERVKLLPDDLWAYHAGRDGIQAWKFFCVLIDRKYKISSFYYSTGSDWYQIRVSLWLQYPAPGNGISRPFFYRNGWKEGSFEVADNESFPAITEEEIVDRLLNPIFDDMKMNPKAMAIIWD